jgi:hypothetical protein
MKNKWTLNFEIYVNNLLRDKKVNADCGGGISGYKTKNTKVIFWLDKELDKVKVENWCNFVKSLGFNFSYDLEEMKFTLDKTSVFRENLVGNNFLIIYQIIRYIEYFPELVDKIYDLINIGLDKTEAISLAQVLEGYKVKNLDFNATSVSMFNSHHLWLDMSHYYNLILNETLFKQHLLNKPAKPFFMQKVFEIPLLESNKRFRTTKQLMASITFTKLINNLQTIEDYKKLINYINNYPND